MAVNENINILVKDLNSMLTALEKVNFIAKEVSNALQYNCSCESIDNVKERLHKLCQKKQQLESQSKLIENNIRSINAYQDALLHIQKEVLSKLGCSLRLTRSGNRLLFKFDYCMDRFIVIGMDDARLRLQQMSPVHENFNKMQELIYISQDLIGLLCAFNQTGSSP